MYCFLKWAVALWHYFFIYSFIIIMSWFGVYSLGLDQYTLHSGPLGNSSSPSCIFNEMFPFKEMLMVVLMTWIKMCLKNGYSKEIKLSLFQNLNESHQVMLIACVSGICILGTEWCYRCQNIDRIKSWNHKTHRLRS